MSTITYYWNKNEGSYYRLYYDNILFYIVYIFYILYFIFYIGKYDIVHIMYIFIVYNIII